MQTVAVTGASGFIGSAVCERLRADGDAVITVDVAGSPDRRADVADPAAVVAALGGADAIVHAAAIVAERGRMADFLRVNVRGTRNVLDAAGPRRVVVLASVAGWGYEFARDLPEDAPPRPCGIPYVDTKGAAETLALRRGATVIRPGDVYGPGSPPWVVRPLEMMAAGRFFLPAPGDGLMTLVYVDDLVDAIVRALREPRAAGRAYTVWDGEPVLARDYFARLGSRPVRTLPAPLLRVAASAFGVGPAALTFVSRRAVYPNARAREELGWAPRTPLADGLARTREWARAARLLDRT
ncbi:MAG TPA: NAD(P)-dependent oxidoreductase [Solirubrobacteraceae bacterium]|nr:NAD(P)-dependent oxidoreductase [Solirubrobacteraceae bacterium]